jgi:predicted HTH domain antitoxin
LTSLRQSDLLCGMTLTLPDQPMPSGMTPEELRLELACALYARGKLTKVRGADFAGVDFFTFQQALKERRISTYSIEDLNREVETLNECFPENPIPKPEG